MNRIRFGLAVTVMLGAIYACAGLFESLTQFGIGLAVSAAAVIGYGLIDFLQSQRDEKLYRHRLEVWARRDAEAAAANQLQPGIYTRRRDEVA